MPEMTPTDAAQRLIEEVRAMDLGDLRDAHNELFPQDPIPPIDPPAHGDAVRRKVLDYLANGVAVEEIIALWSTVFPDAWDVYCDEESGTIHYLVEPEAIPQAD
jgi:hypothetical protein